MIGQCNLLIDIVFPNNAISKWPAIKFADRRTARAMGRIIFLVNSIITIIGIRMGGVPLGTKCLNIVWDKLIQ